MSTDLHARFADLVGGLGHWMPTLFDDEDAQLRRFETELAGQAAAREAPAKDRDVVMIVRCDVIHRTAILDAKSRRSTPNVGRRYPPPPIASTMVRSLTNTFSAMTLAPS